MQTERASATASNLGLTWSGRTTSGGLYKSRRLCRIVVFVVAVGRVDLRTKVSLGSEGESRLGHIW